MADTGERSRANATSKSTTPARTRVADAGLEAGLADSLSQQTMRTLGNAGMQALLGVRRPPPRNAELSVGIAGSAIEREADRIAEEAMRAPGGAATDANPYAMRMPPAHRAPPRGSTSMQVSVQARHEAPTNPGARRAPPVVHRALNAAGRPLDAAVRREMESRFGVDFGGVRIHADALSAASARAIGARAYTHGEDIVFGAGLYRPDTLPGKTLLAHELAHVLQGGGVVHRDGDDAAVESAESGWLDMLWSVLQTIGGGLLGEFNEDPGFAEIGVDLGVSLIPYLDQASDVRDLAAHLYFMCFREGELSRPMRWVGLAFTLIGLFPEIGSAIKGASKLLIRGGRSVMEHLDDLMRIVRRVLGSASSTLDDFVAMIRRSWPEIARFGREMWFSKLAEVRRMLEEVPTFFRSQVQSLIDLIDDIWRRSPRMLDEAMESIDEMMRAGFEALGIRVDGPLFAVADGPPGFFMSMSSHSDEIAEEMGHLSGGGRSLSSLEHTADEAAEAGEEIAETVAGRIDDLAEGHHPVFVYFLHALSVSLARERGRAADLIRGSRAAGRTIESGRIVSHAIRDVVDWLFPQTLIGLDATTHALLHTEFSRVLDDILEHSRFMTELREGTRLLHEWDLGVRGIVERAGAAGILRRLEALRPEDLIDLVERAYRRVFEENPGLVSEDVVRRTFEAIESVRRRLL